MNIDKKELTKEFQKIPGVGKSIAQDFIDLEIKSISDLKNKNPDKLYKQLCELKGTKVCRCMLYVFRCAIYFASEKNHDAKLLNWWAWKD